MGRFGFVCVEKKKEVAAASISDPRLKHGCVLCGLFLFVFMSPTVAVRTSNTSKQPVLQVDCVTVTSSVHHLLFYAKPS